MTTMKIGEDTQAYAAASYSFSNNPEIVDSQLVPNRKFTEVPFGKKHIVSDGYGAKPRNIILTGTFHGTSKRTYYNDLAEHIYDNLVKKFFITSTKFYYFLGGNLKETLKGGRTNFIDYVANLWTPIPFAFSDTESTYTVAIANADELELNDATANSTGNFTNAGNAPSFVKWVIVNTSGNNITQIDIGNASTLAGSKQKIKWTDSTGLASGKTLTIYIYKFKEEDSGYKFMRYGYSEESSVEFGSVAITGDLPYVTKEATDQSFSIQLTGNSDASTITATYRSAYLG